MRGAGLDDAIAVAAPIVADVRDRGDAALLEWTERFDGPRPDGFRVPAERIGAATVDDGRARRAALDDRRRPGVQRGPAAGRHVGRGGAGDRLGAALAAARLGRDLRPERDLSRCLPRS